MTDAREMFAAELDAARNRLARAVAAVDSLAVLQQLAEMYAPPEFCDPNGLRDRLDAEQRARFDLAVTTYNDNRGDQ